MELIFQERPVKETVRKDRPAGEAGKEVHAVRLGVGDRSYLVRDKQIEVLKNVYGGVQVSIACLGSSFAIAHLPQTPTPNCSLHSLMLKSRMCRCISTRHWQCGH